MPSNVSRDDITTKHPMLITVEDQIRRARDCYAGTDAIKQTAPIYANIVLSTDEEYLPRLNGQDKKQYQNYKKRAVFYGTMARTVTALVGAIDRKPPQVNGADDLEDFLKDVTGTGVSLDEFLKDIEEEVMISGRVVVCIDRKNSKDNRPYLVWYKSEDCINWFSEDYADFDQRLSGIVFRESYYQRDPENRYKQKQVDQYREFVMEKGKVTVNIWRPGTPETRDSASDSLSATRPEYTVFQTYELTNRGKSLGFIPCVSVVADGSPFEIPKPPLLDLVDVNIAHYRNSADYEHGMHWTALPTPVLTGLNGKDSNISIGSGSAIILPDPQSSAMFLEFSGTGLGVIKSAMEHKEGMMNTLGARMLASSTDQSTSAEVARINYSGETASLCNVARSMSRGMSRMLRMVARWENKKGHEKIEVRLNEDYVDTKLAGADITALMSAYQGGAISLDSLIWNMSSGERLPLGRTVDDEISLIEGDMDREAEEALFYESEGIGFSGGKFTSSSGSAIRDDNHEMTKENHEKQMEFADEDHEVSLEEKKKDSEAKRKESKQAVPKKKGDK